MHACLAVTCHLHFWQNDWDLSSATTVTWEGSELDSEVRVSTESLTWRGNFTCCSCRDLNPGLFSRKSGAVSVTTELSPTLLTLDGKYPPIPSMSKQCLINAGEVCFCLSSLFLCSMERECAGTHTDGDDL